MIIRTKENKFCTAIFSSAFFHLVLQRLNVLPKSSRILVMGFVSVFIILAPTFCFAGVSTSPRLYRVSVDGNRGFMDSEGQIVIDPKFSRAQEFSEGFAAVEIEQDSWAFIDINGNIVIENRYRRLSSFKQGTAYGVLHAHPERFVVMTNAKGGIEHSKPILGIPYSAKAGICVFRQGRKFGIVDSMGNIICKPEFNVIDEFSEGLASALIVDEDERAQWMYIDREGRKVITRENSWSGARSFHNGLGPVGLDPETWVFIYRTGHYANSKQFYNARTFSEGFASVAEMTPEGLRYGFVDVDGFLRIEFDYYDTRGFVEGLAAVKSDTDNGGRKWGYINHGGETVIEPKYDFAGDFKQGLARVRISEEKGWINRKGEWVWKDQ